MSRKYSYRTINVYVDTDVDIPMGDIMEQIDNEELIDELISRDITPQEKSKILRGFGSDIKTDGIPWTIQDDLKMDIIREAFNKYSIEQLEEKLK